MDKEIYCGKCEKTTEHIKVKPNELEQRIIDEANCQPVPRNTEIYECRNCQTREFYEE